MTKVKIDTVRDLIVELLNYDIDSKLKIIIDDKFQAKLVGIDSGVTQQFCTLSIAIEKER